MQLFYFPQATRELTCLSLEKDDTRHMTKVLRKKLGDKISITNGVGDLFEGMITSLTSNRTEIALNHLKHEEPRQPALHIAIAPTKMNDRMEWFIEKATEIGITSITPILCENSERRKVKVDRYNRIATSAMKQSLQLYKPHVNEFVPIQTFLADANTDSRLIAHCEDLEKVFLNEAIETNQDTTILIGPEGDFTSTEIDRAITNGFKPVSLGSTRLRTETAGIYAVTAFNILNRHR